MRWVERADGCWVWTGARSGDGYGQVQVARRKKRAHRVVYESMVGPVPEGLHLDHLCRNPLCVNPAHLEPVTQAENNRRSAAYGGALWNGAHHQNVKTHCPAGHAYDEENTHINRVGARVCRACKREKARVRRAKERSNV